MTCVNVNLCLKLPKNKPPCYRKTLLKMAFWFKLVAHHALKANFFGTT